MKKIWLLLALSLLSACGSGGGNTAQNTVRDVTAASPSGSLAVTFTKGATKTASLPTTDKTFRVAITNSTLRFNGVPFKVIQDAAPGGTLDFSLPQAGNYTVEAITYTNGLDAKGNQINYVTSYAIAKNVTIGAGVTTLNMVLNGVSPSFVFPASGIIQGNKYTAQINYSTAGGRTVTPLQQSWYMFPPQTTPFATPFVNNTSTTLYSTIHSYTAPYPGAAGTKLYFQGIFPLKSSMIDVNENNKQWVFNFSNISTNVQIGPSNVHITAP